MTMSKKFKAAITVAAIAGTCALADPSFAAWESDAPTKLGTDIVASAADNTDGIVVVGDDGKAYHMTAAKMLNANTSEIDWTQVFPPASGDFVGVVHVDDMFLAVTEDGTIVVSDNGEKGRWQKHPLSAVLKGHLGDKKLVGLASDLTSKAVVVTADGSAFYYDHSVADQEKTIKPINRSGGETGILAGEAIATNSNVRGIDFLTGHEDTFMVYGAGGGADNANNLYKITTAGAVEGFNLYNCPAINDFAFPTSGIWYAAGDGGAIVLSDDDLSGEGKNIDDNKLDIPGNFSSNLFSIEYNSDKELGYASGKSGSLLEISRRDVTVVNQTVSQQDLNAVSLAIDENLKRAFVSGNDGASLYGTQTYWQTALGGMIDVCPVTPKTILSLGSKFYSIDGEEKKLYSSTNPAETWTDLSAVYPHAAHPGVSAAASVGGADYVAFGLEAFPDGQSAQGGAVIFKVKEGEETKATVLKCGGGDVRDIKFMTVLNNGDSKYLCVVNDVARRCVAYIDIATTEDYPVAAQAASRFTSSDAIKGLAASSRALYVSEGGKLYVMTTGTGDEAKITTVPSTENTWTEIAASKFDDEQVDKLYSATDGTVLFTTTDNSIYILHDDIGDDGNKAIFISPQNWGYNGAKPVSLSGGSNDLVVATVDDVWRCKDRLWEKYGDLDGEVTSMAAVDGVASIGEKVLAIDTTNNALAYSGGGVFKVAIPETGPAVGANIGDVYNATKSEVYVAGDQGLLYKGTKGEGEASFTWTDENADVFGAKKIYAVTGIGEHLFVAYKNGESNSHSIATKELNADSWTLLSGERSGAVIDLKALSNTDLIVNRGTLYHVKINDGSASWSQLTAKQGCPELEGSYAALDMFDAEHLYAIAGNELTKLTEPSDDVWKSEKISLPEAQTLRDIVVLSEDKVYMVGDHGYVAVYDGATVKIIAAPDDVTLSSCWAYEEMLYACDWSGKVHQYNFETGEWSSGIAQNDTKLYKMTGSSKGGYLFAAGIDNTLVRTEISSSGGGETNTTVHPGHGEKADLVLRTVEEDRTPEELTSTNKTPTMEVVGHVETFTTKPGLVVGSVHNFNFSVTPATDTPVADLHLFKLLAANGGSNIEYERQDSIPAAATNGVFWVTDGGGNVMSTSDTLLANTVYTINFGVKDGGEYDSDGAADGVIIDPVVLGNTGSSSGGSGCVFNPAQTFGLEWLMLAFAPLAAFFRSRFKK